MHRLPISGAAMRTFPALALGVALTLVTTSPATAQIAVAGLVLDIAGETRDLVFQTEDLEVMASDLEVKETETEIRIELAADVLFDFDSANLRAEAEQALGSVAEIIRKHQGAGVRVEGHTDSKGSDNYNRRLSERRARSVRDWLLSAEGLSATDFKTTGFGESKPSAANEKPDGSDDPEGRQKNRRVEIVVQKR